MGKRPKPLLEMILPICSFDDRTAVAQRYALGERRAKAAAISTTTKNEINMNNKFAVFFTRSSRFVFIFHEFNKKAHSLLVYEA